MTKTEEKFAEELDELINVGIRRVGYVVMKARIRRVKQRPKGTVFTRQLLQTIYSVYRGWREHPFQDQIKRRLAERLNYETANVEEINLLALWMERAAPPWVS